MRKQQPLHAQILDVRTALSTACEYQQEMGHDLATVVNRRPVAVSDGGIRQRSSKSNAVCKTTKSVETRMRDDLAPATLNHDRCCAANVHLGSALRSGYCCWLQAAVSL